MMRAQQPIELRCPYWLAELMTRSDTSMPLQHTRKAWLCPSERSHGSLQAPRVTFPSLEAQRADQQSPVTYYMSKYEKGYHIAWQPAVRWRNHTVLNLFINPPSPRGLTHDSLSWETGRYSVCLRQHPLYRWEAIHNTSRALNENETSVDWKASSVPSLLSMKTKCNRNYFQTGMQPSGDTAPSHTRHWLPTRGNTSARGQATNTPLHPPTAFFRDSLRGERMLGEWN